MLIAILLDASLAVISSVIFAVLASIIFHAGTNDLLFDFHFGFVSLVVCLVAVFSIQKASQRSAVLKTGMLISFVRRPCGTQHHFAGEPVQRPGKHRIIACVCACKWHVNGGASYRTASRSSKYRSAFCRHLS